MVQGCQRPGAIKPVVLSFSSSIQGAGRLIVGVVVEVIRGFQLDGPMFDVDRGGDRVEIIFHFHHHWFLCQVHQVVLLCARPQLLCDEEILGLALVFLAPAGAKVYKRGGLFLLDDPARKHFMVPGQAGHVLDDAQEQLFVEVSDSCPIEEAPFEGVLSGEVVVNVTVHGTIQVNVVSIIGIQVQGSRSLHRE